MNAASNQQITTLQVFYNESENVSVRIKVINGEPWFVGKDVCNLLGIVNHKDALSRLDDDERRGVGITVPLGGNQQFTCINESGLYHLIFISRKPEAKSIRRWVTGTVLPSIRRTGSYSSASRPTSNRLPLPKYRPYFDKWKEHVSPYVSQKELTTVACALAITLSHVRKVYAGTSMSERVARAITELARQNKQSGVVYPKAVPVYEQLMIDWEE